jgi:hypothetical protein
MQVTVSVKEMEKQHDTVGRHERHVAPEATLELDSTSN